MINFVDEFLREVISIDDSDYGDFMRKANLHFNVLQQALWPLANDSIKMKLSEMHDYIQYEPNWDIPSTEEKIQADGSVLKNLIAKIQNSEKRSENSFPRSHS